ncbi:MAG: hypothetical protein JEY97_08165 [Bacteroidales bacterium]|nr:hypothetical protein [Bacteroidales bacterium]
MKKLLMILVVISLLSSVLQAQNTKNKVADRKSIYVTVLTGFINTNSDSISNMDSYSGLISHKGDTIEKRRWTFGGIIHYEILTSICDYNELILFIEYKDNKTGIMHNDFEIKLDFTEAINIELTENIILELNDPLKLTKKKYKKYKKRFGVMPQRSGNSRAIDVR